MTFSFFHFTNENSVMNDTTTKEIVSMTGLSWGTLNQYVRFGWTQAPEIVPYGKGNGRGSRLLWDKDVVNQVEQIQAYKKLGNSLEQIDDILQGEKS